MDNNNSDPNNPTPFTSGLGQPVGMPPTDSASIPLEPPSQLDEPQSSIAQNPSAPAGPAPAAQTPWPSSASTAGFGAPAQPADQGATNPMAANPFLQSQAPGMGLPGAESTAMPPAPVPGQAPEANNLFQTLSSPLTQDPMNNAFPPAENLGEPNLLQPQVPPIPEPPPPTMLDQPAASDPVPPASDPPVPENPAATSTQQGTLDLSALQSNSGSAENPLPQQPGNPLPNMGPQENAPTDLSHLIAGDESHQPGDIYAPPVAQDQNPAVTPIQTSPDAQGTPPPGKHLNLTKVLLVAGIPIILIVAALSAYLILGIGKPASNTTNQTSLPIEQTKQQAPLTNPPQQITAPSPVSIPQPQTNGTESSISGSVLPGASSSPAASLSPAMQAALKKASPSPSSTTTPPAIP